MQYCLVEQFNQIMYFPIFDNIAGILSFILSLFSSWLAEQFQLAERLLQDGVMSRDMMVRRRADVWARHGQGTQTRL